MSTSLTTHAGTRERTDDLTTRAQAGDIEAFNQLAHRYRAPLRSFLYRLTAHREDAEDLTQEAFLRAYQKLHTFESRSSFRTWLFAIANRLAMDHHRAKKRWRSNAQDRAKELTQGTPALVDELLEAPRQASQAVYEIREHIDFCFTCIIKTLPLEQHVALMLRDIYTFTNAEAAEIMGQTVGVVKHLLHNARKTMRAIFDNRCALIDKQGTCHQCSELNGIFNGKQTTQAQLVKIDMVRAAQDATRAELFALRTELVRAIDPLNASGTNLHETIMRIVRQASAEA